MKIKFLHLGLILLSVVLSNAQDHGVIIGSSFAQGILVEDQKGYQGYAIEKATGMKWYQLSQSGTETSFAWVTLAIACNKKPAPKYAIVMSRHVMWAMYTARTGGKWGSKGVNQINAEPEPIKTSMMNEYNAIKARGTNVPDYPDYYSEGIRKWWDFNKNVDSSFLPPMARDAKAAGTKLIFINFKDLLYAHPDRIKDNPEVDVLQKQYGKDMKAWCDKNGVYWVDLANESQLKWPNVYCKTGTDDHVCDLVLLNALIAPNIKAIVEGKVGPNMTPVSLLAVKARPETVTPFGRFRLASDLRVGFDLNNGEWVGVNGKKMK